MSELTEIKGMLNRQTKLLADLTIAVTGDEDLGIIGIVGKLKEHEKAINQYKGDRAKVLGATTAVGIFFGWFSAWFTNHFWK